MDFESWWLVIIPILFGLGWLAARLDMRQMMSETRHLPDSYFKGLNFLLNEDHDQAIDAFVEVAKLDTETTELHFALGSLFRRRGEVERAIRVHQSLLNRADLPAKDQAAARYELAQDFLKAGMFDRAEAGFVQAAQDEVHAIAATRALIRIYEAEHDWPQAIGAVKKLQKLLSEPVPQVVHYYCELAVQALTTKPSNIPQAQQELAKAEQALNSFQGKQGSQARMAMINAQIARLQDNLEQEHHYLQQIMRLNPEYMGLVAQEFVDNYTKQGQGDAGVRLLQEHYRLYPSLDLFNVIFKYLRTHEQASQAWAFARESLSVSPSLLGLDKLLEVELKADATVTPSLLPDLQLDLLRKMIHKHSQRLDRYACRHCGFQARAFYWQCPGCNSWESYDPKRLEELS